jgi:hypothetical protein
MPPKHGTTAKAANAGAQTASTKAGCLPVISPSQALAVSAKKMYSPRIPQDTANVISVKGSSAAVGTGRSWTLVSGVMAWNPFVVARRVCVHQVGSGPSSSTATGDDRR